MITFTKAIILLLSYLHLSSSKATVVLRSSRKSSRSTSLQAKSKTSTMTSLERDYEVAIIKGVMLGVADHFNLDADGIKELMEKKDEIDACIFGKNK